MTKYKLVVYQGVNWDNYLMCPKKNGTIKGESIENNNPFNHGISDS
ncbi:hypothetical protein UFOVP181_108 [uncultured Caudovirales phage]|uniref:Uncharacterized protein n=1 Tax=uncultured Caudovirales phage TaxID=2100421 RepID=A0A6J7WDT8_9CAUD|nr:hypothetical protein UFOVP57_54 [uncultured Caudovirales phage]CAB5208660.1 hypothetical protein UFOVP181_108 [uncultured Caudovirales phage]